MTTLYRYSVSSVGNRYEITPEAPVTGSLRNETLNGGTFRFDSDKYTYLGGADEKNLLGNEDGFFAQIDGKVYFFTTTDYGSSPPTEKMALNTAQSYTIQCFMAGTRIATPQGLVAVEDLAAGDVVLTADGRQAPVKWLGVQAVSTIFGDPNRILPIRIKAHAIADQVPTRDLLLSPSHAVLIDAVLVQAAALVNGTTVVRESTVPTTFTYYHVELDAHSLLLAEGTPAESFLDGVENLAFQNWQERDAPGNVEELPYPRVKSARQLPAKLAARLAQRALLIDAANAA